MDNLSDIPIRPAFTRSLDALSDWRAALCRQIDGLLRYLEDHELAATSARDALLNIKQRLANEKLVVAFVAEFSRGKSELINAIFFADVGKRVLPAAPGRTTMCPVELGFEVGEPPLLALLPIETRLDSASLIELRQQPEMWRQLPLVVGDADALARTLREVMRTQWVPESQARALGFWDDQRPDDNPPRNDEGLVEVPQWRHALINYPHPLLQQGLVVLDTPGLNAIGAEPELTLNLLPTAHATLFILAADTGVTKSDLAIWRDHLGSHPLARYVVLNKIDTLIDPLATPAEVEAQIEAQRLSTARTLDVPAVRVFPLSARQGLAARIGHDNAALQLSRLPVLEQALSEQLLPQRRKMLEAAVADASHDVQAHVARRIGAVRRQLAEQSVELNSLRGKSSAKVRMMLDRVQSETGEFEQCTTRLHALRVVHARMMKDALVDLSSDRLREEVEQMQMAMSASIMNLGAKKAFTALCNKLRSLLDSAHLRGQEIRDMLIPSFSRLNAEFGFSLALQAGPELSRFKEDLDLLEKSYVQYLGVTQALRLSQPKFMEQFRRMLLSKLRMVFETASNEFEMWNKSASAQVDSQLRERRHNFRKRRESLERIQVAAGELEQRIAEVEAQDARLKDNLERVTELAAALREQAGQVDFSAATPLRLDVMLDPTATPD
ncbi:MAG: dynamin family protein [Pseudomonadota bacterium]